LIEPFSLGLGSSAAGAFFLRSCVSTAVQTTLMTLEEEREEKLRGEGGSFS